MKTIKITGTGIASATPNQIELQFNLTTLNLNYDKALSLHDEKLNKLIQITTNLKLKKEDLKTSSFNIRPTYKSVKKLNGDYKEEFQGYAINQNLTLTFDYDMDLLDEIVNNISNSNINPRFNIYFTIKEKEDFQNKLLESACIDARKKAEILAKACNQTIEGILEINYSFSNIYLYSNTKYDAYESEMKMSKCSSIAANITPKDIESKENVSFVFEIK